ncbi:MAG: hypothetical protein IH627_15665 [Rubrivivax sp.]|nr:hypothetical protein [Rubrivivax sp.]
MTRIDRSAPGSPVRTSKPTPSAAPRARGHGEWRLDEALAETFPASDPIAVTPIRAPRATPRATSRKAAKAARGSDCSTAVDIDAESEGTETPIECRHCRNSIAETVALNFEGADDIHHFCGPQCLDAWRTTVIVHDE